MVADIKRVPASVVSAVVQAMEDMRRPIVSVAAVAVRESELAHLGRHRLLAMEVTRLQIDSEVAMVVILA